MHCSDLERYLEACLDGQLGASRRQSLQDHLRLCRGCAERVDGLRRFEADLQRRLRAMQHEVSLWQPLGLEVVDGGPARAELPMALAPFADDAAPVRRRHRLRLALPAADPGPTPGHRLPRRGLQRLAGVALLAAAVGALADVALTGLGWLGSDRRIAVYRSYLDGTAALDVHTEEPVQLSAWFADQLGGPVDLPALPSGFALVGGKTGEAGLAAGAALAVYSTEEGPALLVIESSLERPLALGDEPTLAVDKGLTRLDWQSGPHAYSLISALPPDKLAAFAAD
jgi:anti-sigma factor RsiW